MDSRQPDGVGVGFKDNAGVLINEDYATKHIKI
jgi:hypothetical protein